MPHPKIVFVGGGSYAWTPKIARDILMTPSLQNAHLVLFDIDKKTSDRCQVLLDKIANQLGIKAKITSTDQRAYALKDANYVLLTLSTGGLKAMGHDLAIPQDYSIYHTVGDTSGPGGWARLIRNFDVFVGLAKAIQKYAPQAVVLNYTNPMTTLTDVLCRLLDNPVVGLCHGLFENLLYLKMLYKLESEDELAVQYAGINHFFWITHAKGKGKDVMSDLNGKLRRRSFTDLIDLKQADPMGFASGREVATELMRTTGMLPYLGDRHTCEFFPQFITNRKMLKQYRLVRTTIADRQKYRRDARRLIDRNIKNDFDEGFLKRSRETAADIINAHLTGQSFIDVGNLPNIGQISNLSRNLVVETAVRVDANGFTPLAFGDLPQPAQSMIEPWGMVFPMLVDACFEGDLNKALQALRLDPTCSHLSTPRVHEMGKRLLKAHRRFISTF